MLVQIVLWLVIVFGTINLVRMALFMIGADLYNLQHAFRKKKFTLTDIPTFSVVIPAFNEERTIERCVRSALNSEYPRNKLQIIVVDDGSTDRTVELVENYRAIDERVLLIKQPNTGKAHALNNGIKNHATGELIMCLDADSAIAPNALTNAARYFQDPRVVALASNVKIRHMRTFLNLVQQFEYLISYQIKRALTFFNIEYIIGGVGSTFRRSALEKCNYYDTNTMTEDIDLTFKLFRGGNKDARVMYGADVISYTESVLSVGALIRQRYRWKFGRSQTFLKNMDMFFSRHPRHNKFLTWAYLPFALFCDLAFFFEPLVIGYILFALFNYSDWTTLLSALMFVSMYITLNVLAEDTIPWKERLPLAFLAPTMYLFFYVLSYVEYVALLKTYGRAKTIRASLQQNACGWTPVERAASALTPGK